jgi:hypothetical protein
MDSVNGVSYGHFLTQFSRNAQKKIIQPLGEKAGNATKE